LYFKNYDASSKLVLIHVPLVATEKYEMAELIIYFQLLRAELRLAPRQHC